VEYTAAGLSIAEDEGTLLVTVTRHSGCAGTVTVDFASADVTATSGTDYTAASGTLVFGDREFTRTFAVEVFEDASDESDETLTVDLTNPTGGLTVGAQSTATITITDTTPTPSGGGGGSSGGGCVPGNAGHTGAAILFLTALVGLSLRFSRRP
jgi:hypothetical protein